MLMIALSIQRELFAQHRVALDNFAGFSASLLLGGLKQ